MKQAEWKIACKQLYFDELLDESKSNQKDHWKKFIAIEVGHDLYDVYPVGEGKEVFLSGDFEIKKL
jgi:hypothetical protein